MLVRAFDQRSIAIVKTFLLEYQNRQGVPCTLNFLDSYVDFGMMENEKFHILRGQFYSNIKLKTGCDIFICSSKFLESEAAEKIDKSSKSHLWIVDGTYSNKQLNWPVLEVKSKISKLYCPKDPEPKLILLSSVRFCPEYPTMNGQPLKVSMFGFWPTLFKGPGGSLMGFEPRAIELLSEFAKFKPNYVFKARTFDESLMLVHNGTVDLGTKVSMTYKRSQLVDFPSFVDYTELVHGVQVPQPVDVFYQFLQPFELVVWITWIVALGLFCTLTYFVTRMAKLQGSDYTLNQVRRIDFALYSFGSSIQPLISHKWIEIIRSKTSSGFLVVLWLAVAGFLVVNLYKTVLLSYLTAKSYEKPIDTIKDLLESDLKKYHFNDESFYLMKDDTRKECRELYALGLKNGWVVNSMSEMPKVLKGLYGGKHSFMSPKMDFNAFLKDDIEKGRGILIRKLTEEFRSFPRSFTVPKNGPLTRTFEKIIMRAVDHGLFLKIVYQYNFRKGEFFFIFQRYYY